MSKQNYPPSKSRNYALAMLTIIFAFNFVDRQILVILQELIKSELDLSDTQLGLLTGFAFVGLYATLGIPIAYFADKGNRRNIIAGSVFIWSAMTTFTGLAQNYLQLFLLRVGVGIGEAGGTPPSHSMIADYFPPSKRSTALSIHQMGASLGILIGFLIGGIVGQMYGWRVGFVVAGVPGILIAAIFYFTVKEPQRIFNEAIDSADNSSPSMGLFASIGYLLRVKVFLYTTIGVSVASFAVYGMINFTAPFLIRSYGLSLAEVGTTLALVHGVGGAIGTLMVGVLADRLAVKGNYRRFLLASICMFFVFPFAAYAYVSQEQVLSIVLYAIAASLFLGPMGAVIGAVQQLIRQDTRALSTSIIFFMSNLIGLGCGPLFIGVISDLYYPEMGNESLRLGLTLCTLGFLASGAIFIWVARITKLGTIPSDCGRPEIKATV